MGILDYLREGVVQLGRNGRVLDCNAEAARLLGKEGTQGLRGESWLSLAPWLPPAGPGHAAEKEWNQLLPDGTEARVRGRIEALPDGTGLVSLEDLTELRGLERQFSEAQKMESLGRLAGGIAHDFRNILTVVHVNSALVLEELTPDHCHRGALEEIHLASQRGTDLVGQLVAHLRPRIPSDEVVDLREVVDHIGPLVRRVVGEDIEVSVEHGSGRLGVRMDPVRIEQVVLNLVTNARDAMPRGGRLTIRTQVRQVDEEQARAYPGMESGGYACLTIRDTGEGMPAHVRERIFEPFFTTKDPDKGTGLGMATVLRLIRGAGGHVWVYSEPDQGTVFRIHLPLAAMEAGMPEEDEEPRRPAAGAEAGETASTAGPTVLLVEDDPAIRSVLQQILERNGVQVLSAGSGEDAIRLAGSFKGRLHCLLTDLNLPGRSGAEVGRVVRELHPDARVAVMSGYGPEELDPDVLEQLDATFLEKPFAPRALLDLLASMGAVEPRAARS